MIRFDAHDDDDLAHETLPSWNVAVPLIMAVAAIVVAGFGLAITYMSALLSLGDLAGARWWAALTYLVSVHLLFAFEFGQLRRFLRANRNTPMPSCRQLRSDLAGGRAWVARLGLALLALFAWAHLSATSWPTAVAATIPLVSLLSLDIVSWGIRPAQRALDWMLQQLPPAGGAP